MKRKNRNDGNCNKISDSLVLFYWSLVRIKEYPNERKELLRVTSPESNLGHIHGSLRTRPATKH